jgi:hypothetical protein
MHANENAAPAPASDDLAFTVDTCAGGASDASAVPGARIGPHEWTMTIALTATYTDARWLTNDARVPAGPDIRGPDKVPISLS